LGQSMYGFRELTVDGPFWLLPDGVLPGSVSSPVHQVPFSATLPSRRSLGSSSGTG
jgi:hypothetical protein